MSNIKINDVYQRIQYSATLNQTVFAVPFPFFQNNYLFVWVNGIQLVQGGAPGQYSVAGAGSPSGGTVTLVTPSINGDVVTIEGKMPIDRTSIYSATISNLTGSDLNGDFNREVVMMKQIETVQDLLQLQYAPWEEVSQDVDDHTDRYLPILLPLYLWRKNANNTAIEQIKTPASGGLAPDDGTYLVNTADADLPDAIPLDTFSTGFMFNNLSSGFGGTRVFQPTLNQITITNPDGAGGNPVWGIADNPLIGGTAGMGIPQGNTAQRVVPISGIGLRYNSEIENIEYWDGAWFQLQDSGDVSQLIARLAAHTVGDGASMIGLQDQSGVTSKTVQDLANAALIAKTDNGTLTNGQFLSALASGLVYVTTTTGVLGSRVATGTANQITVANGDGIGGNPTWSIPAIFIAPGTVQSGNIRLNGNTIETLDTNGDLNIAPNGTGFFKINNTQGVNAIINDGTLASATSNNLASAAALKTYIDTVASGLAFLTAVVAASTTNYTATYFSAGAGGIGDTLTNAAAMAAFSIDGVSPTVNQRVLIKNQSTAAYNGVYTVTTVGSGAVNWVLTRATDFDENTEIVPGVVIPVLLGGTANAGTSWLQTATVSVVGTDAIDFIQFTATLPLSMSNGGTGANLTPSNGGIIYSNASTMAVLAGTATANKPLLSGSSAAPSWGAFALNMGGAITTAGAFTISGSFGATFTLTNTTSVTFPTSGTLATTSQLPSPSALTKNDDTNVTLTLGGNPSTALLQAVSLTLGWSGTLGVTRGGTGLGTFNQGDILYASAANTLAALAKNTSATRYLSNTGTTNNPAWAQIDLTNGVTGTLPVGNGGSGNTTFTAYSVLCAGTTSTGAFQNVSGVGTSGQVLTSNGAGLLPTWQAAAGGSGFTSIVVQAFLTNGSFTYTPTASMKYCVAEIVGAGAAGGGCTAGAVNSLGGGGGGGAGGYARKVISAATIGASKAVTVGAGGTGGTGGGNPGGTSSLGVLVTATGGQGGGALTGSTAFRSIPGGAGGAGASGDFNTNGGQGGFSITSGSAQAGSSGDGGNSIFGGGGYQRNGTTAQTGANGSAIGGGGSGGLGTNASNASGGAGADGAVIITEFI